MKFTVLALGAAVAGLSCVSPCSAQLNIESFGGAQPASRLAFQGSQAGEDVFSQASPQAPVVDSDYFAEGAPGEGLGEGLSDPKSILTEQPSAFTSAPQSVPQSPAPAQAPFGVLANTPEVGMVPVCWPEGMRGCRTPNPIADIMMQSWCTDGLWDTYAADRACQCAHIQHHTGGFNRYTHGYSHGCVNGCSQGCSTCAPVHAWPAPAASSCASAASTAPVASIAQAPQKPVAQLVISPVMSAPAQLPTAQVAPSQTPSEYSIAPAQPAPVQHQQAPAQEYRATPNPLPAEPLPAQVPVVASRSAGLVR